MVIIDPFGGREGCAVLACQFLVSQHHRHNVCHSKSKRGGLFTVMSPTVAELFGTGSHGLLFGLVLFSGTLGGAAGPLMAGGIFDLTGSYRLVFIILTALALVGAALVATLQPPAQNVPAT
jgi:MFS family permease